MEGQFAWWCLQSFFFFFAPKLLQRAATTLLQTVAMSELKRELYIMSMLSRVATNDASVEGMEKSRQWTDGSGS